jgi:SSS family transporter
MILTNLDLFIIFFYLMVVISIGISQRKKSNSMAGFALGNKQMAWWAVLASILAAEISAGSMFGVPGDGFRLKNFTYAQLLIGYLLARIIVSAVFIPAYYRLGVVSVYELLNKRFGPLTYRLCSAVFIVTRLLASGTRLWAPTLIIVIAWKIQNPNLALSKMNEFWMTGIALCLVAAATAIYTTIGGIRAVIATDVIQVVVLITAIFFSFGYLWQHLPHGWSSIQETFQQPTDLIFWDSGLTKNSGFWHQLKDVLEQEYTLWAAFIASTFVTLATHGTDQDMVQRMLTAKNKKESARATLLSGIVDIPITLAFLAIGIMLHWYYLHHQHPSMDVIRAADGQFKSREAFPFFVLTEMPSGLRGLIIAGLLSAAMGSLGTALNSLATSYVRDFHFHWFGQNNDEKRNIKILKISTIVFAILLISVGLATSWVAAGAPSLGILSIILGIFGYTYGSLLGIFLLALFTKNRGSEIGNLIAIISGFIVVSYLSGLDLDLAKHLGTPKLTRPTDFPIIEFPWRILFGTLTTFSIGVCFKSTKLNRGLD